MMYTFSVKLWRISLITVLILTYIFVMDCLLSYFSVFTHCRHFFLQRVISALYLLGAVPEN